MNNSLDMLFLHLCKEINLGEPYSGACSPIGLLKAGCLRGQG